MPEPRKDRFAPEDAVCTNHDERPAFATCPVCKRHVCIACWHIIVDRCGECLARDPGAVAKPVPWEEPNASLAARLGRTLAEAFRPNASAPSFMLGETGGAVRFALLTMIPVAALRGIVPYTHTLIFGNGFGISTIGSPSALTVVIDVLRAMGLGIALHAAYGAALTVPFVSLSRAYGSSKGSHAALYAMLYRGWLLGFSTLSSSPTSHMFGLIFWVGVWGAPAGYTGEVAQVLAIVELVPVLLLFWSMRATARMGHNVGPFASYIVVLVPFALMVVLQLLIEPLLVPLLPAGIAATGVAS